jgi:hypothetical protein
MKLRFRENSLRLRVNRREVEALASGAVLTEHVHFPGEASISYVLEPSTQPVPGASFEQGTIRVSAPRGLVRQWAADDSIGIYFELPANGAELKIAIEKDLDCIDASGEERDPDAFSRSSKNC